MASFRFPSRQGPLSETRLQSLTPIELALEGFFRRATRAGLSVAALRGARTAPLYRGGGGDLDLLCSRRDLPRMRELLHRELRRTGTVVVSERRANTSVLQLQLFTSSGAEEPGSRHLCIDVHTAETCYGVPFLRAEEIECEVTGASRPARPIPAASATVDFLTPFLSAGHVHPEYAARLQVAADQHPLEVRDLLGQLAGTGRADRLMAALRSASALTLRREARPLRRAILARAFARRPVASALGLASCLWYGRLLPLTRPRGMTVALLGADGTGKSTLADALHAELRPAFRSAANRTIKLRPGLLPQIGRLFGRRPTMEEYERPHRARPSGTLGTWLRAGWYWLDYVLGTLVKVAPLRRRNTLILFDRYATDWTVDPARYRMASGSRVVRALARLAPRPDVTIVTTAPLRTVRARKTEVSTRESLRQLEAYAQLAEDDDRTFVVSTHGRVEDALEQCLMAMFMGVQAPVPGLSTPFRTAGSGPPRGREAA